jgi:hypothetical protein
MKKWLILASGVIVVSIVGFYLATSTYRPTAQQHEAAPSVQTHPTPASGAPAVWASHASTIPQLVAEADIIARVRAVERPKPRLLSMKLPIVTDDGKTIGEKVDTVLFSDTTMEVLAVYKGSADKQIIVMQTGGEQPGGIGQGQTESLEGDPLFTKGEESILFLVNISHDQKHALGRTLYRVVNPAGRYTIKGSQVFNHAEFSPSDAPKTAEELVMQIKQAVKP